MGWTSSARPRLAPVSARTSPRGGLRQVTVFLGSSDGRSTGYAAAAADLGDALARSGLTVVYGGGRVGLMGTLADAALGAGGQVIGVMPRALADREIAHQGLTRLDVVADMHERKQRMASLGDAFVALPGGAGTLEELFEAWTWQRLGLHDKPVALLGPEGFWAPHLHMLDHLVAEGFLAPTHRTALIVASTPEQLLERLRGWPPRS